MLESDKCQRKWGERIGLKRLRVLRMRGRVANAKREVG